MSRTSNFWKTNSDGDGYIQTIAPDGYDILINGTSKYLNFNTTVGTSGYGFRDNVGTMEFKNSGGAWATFASLGSTAIWGSITGTLSNQTDLQNALNLKANLASPTFTGTVVLPSTTSIGNVSDTELSYLDGVTSAIQTQINAKQATITFGTGVQTALGVNIGSAGAPVLFNGALGTPTSGVATNLTGTASGLTAGNVTTNANLTGVVTSIGNATAIADNALSIAKTSGLQSALDLKAPLASPTFTGTVTVPTPTNATDAATKAYADSIAQSLDIKASVRVASTVDIAIATALINGSTIDGVVVATGDRVLLKNQTAGAENGIYLVVASGVASRSADADSSAEVTSGMYVFVSEGTVSIDTGFVLTTNDPITLGTTVLVFTQFSGAGQIVAGNGLSKSANTLSIDTAITVDKTTVQTLTNKTLTSPTLTTPTLGVATGTSLALGGATIGTNALAVTGSVNVQGGRSLFAAASEPYAIGTRYVSTGGSLYFGASSGSATPDGGIYNAGGSQIIGFNNDRSVTIPAGNLTLSAGLLTQTGAGNNSFAGNVGIGTAVPGAKLTISGASTYNEGFTSGTLFVANSADANRGVDIGYDPNLEAGFLQAGKSGVGYKAFLLNPNAGNVGIGETSPQAKLSIGISDAANVDEGIILDRLGAATTRLGLKLKSNSGGYYRGALEFTQNTGSVTEVISFGNETGSVGNVGIGTTAPGAPLNIISASSADGALVQKWGYTAATNADGAGAYNLKLKQTVGAGVVKWGFDMYNNGTAYADILVFNNGNVGIGNPAPARKLDVAGSANFDGVVGLQGYTTATLPAGTQGDIAFITDGTVVPAKGIAPVGGGASVGVVFYNGTIWVGI